MQISFIEIETNRCLYKCCAGHSLFIFFSLGHGIYLSQRKLVKPEVVALGLRCDINFKSLLWLWNKSALTHHIFSGAHCIYCVVNGDFLTFQFYRFEIQSNCPWYSLGPYVVNGLQKDHKMLVFIYETSGISYWWNFWSWFSALSVSHASCYIYASHIYICSYNSVFGVVMYLTYLVDIYFLSFEQPKLVI